MSEQCAPACQQAHPFCFDCLGWWFALSIKNGKLPRCPNCKEVSRKVKTLHLDVGKMTAIVRPPVGASVSGSASGASAPGAIVDQEPGFVPSAEYDIGYIAGVRIKPDGEAEYKVVWCKRDMIGCEPSEPRFVWQSLAHVVETSSKVLGFHKRWLIGKVDTLPPGFIWEHDLPVSSRGKWRCPIESCGFITDLESNCRKHCGSVHSGRVLRCLLCGVGCSTVSNLRKHMKKHNKEALAVSESS
ncbi:MAG: hypothetical protein P4L81_03405 [Candidatus Pacebacteria bacterium]|nr:hypothetical protein [Candidatus Paceibacterota bacterium]